MPAKSKAQYRLMQAAKHNPKVAKKMGIAPSTAAEFVSGVDYKNLPARKRREKEYEKARKALRRFKKGR